MTESLAAHRHGLWDTCGSWASSACAVHCLVSPLLFLLIPTFAEIWAHPASHALMAVAVVPLALTVILRGYRQHRVRWVAIAAACGIAFILVGSALPYVETGKAATLAGSEEHGHCAEDEHATDASHSTCDSCCPSVVTDEEGKTRLEFPPASIVTILGSVFLVSAHLGNRRHRLPCDCV